MKKMRIYKIKKLKFMNDVIEIDKRKIKSKWSFVMQKKMQMIACWIFLFELKNQNVDIKFAKIKKWLIRSNVKNAWLLMLRFMFVFQLHDKFHFACRKNSKLKILFRNIRSQMNLISIRECHFLLFFFFYMWKIFICFVLFSSLYDYMWKIFTCFVFFFSLYDYMWMIFTNCNRWKTFSTSFFC